MTGLLVLSWLVMAGIMGAFAGSRGRSAIGFCLLSLVFSPLLALIVLLVGRNPAQEAKDEAKRKAEHELQLAQIRAIAGKPDPAWSPAPPISVAAEIERLASLEDRGLISHAEFVEHKRRLLDPT